MNMYYFLGEKRNKTQERLPTVAHLRLWLGDSRGPGGGPLSAHLGGGASDHGLSIWRLRHSSNPFPWRGGLDFNGRKLEGDGAGASGPVRGFPCKRTPARGMIPRARMAGSRGVFLSFATAVAKWISIKVAPICTPAYDVSARRWFLTSKPQARKSF